MKIHLLLPVILLAGCVTMSAASGPTPKERVTECVDICRGVGLKMSALVVIRGSAGCVCTPPDAKVSAATGSAAAIAAGALVAQEDEEDTAGQTPGPVGHP